MGPTTLFTHLKIILLQCFQFSVFSFSFTFPFSFVLWHFVWALFTLLFFIFFSSSTPLELASLFFFLFSFLLFVYSRAFKKLSLSFSLSHKQILSHTHIDHRQRSGDRWFCASPLFSDEKQREIFFLKRSKRETEWRRKRKEGKRKKFFFFFFKFKQYYFKGK